MKQTGFAVLKGQDGNTIRINTKYILGYTYDERQDKTLIFFVGMQDAVYYPGDQRHEISLAISSS